MVGDTFITGGPLGVRGHEHQIKVVAGTDTRALIGFAGDQHHGAAAVLKASALPSGPSTASYLQQVACEYPVDFAYGFRDEAGIIHLLKISADRTDEVISLYLGHAEAFAQFQAIRHRADIDPAPKAIETMIFGSASPDPAPRALSQSTAALLRLFSERAERDVGGVAIPYMLGRHGVFLCEYGYGVTAPITDQLKQGNLIQLGSSSEGGFSLGVSSYHRNEGVVVYWFQKHGGIVFLRGQTEYQVIQIDGSPSEFRRRAHEILGDDVHIWFTDEETVGTPEHISVLYDQTGKPTITVARRGNSIQFHAIDTSPLRDSRIDRQDCPE
jgi:hypothetical protein